MEDNNMKTVQKVLAVRNDSDLAVLNEYLAKGWRIVPKVGITTYFTSDASDKIYYVMLEEEIALRREEFDIIGVLKSSFPRRCQPHRKNETY